MNFGINESSPIIDKTMRRIYRPQGWPILARTGRPGKSLCGSAWVCGKKSVFRTNKGRLKLTADGRRRAQTRDYLSRPTWPRQGFSRCAPGVTSEHSHQSMNFGINESSPIIDKTMRGFIARRAGQFWPGQVVRAKVCVGPRGSAVKKVFLEQIRAD